MIKYVFPVICFSLFFLLPMKDLKDENKYLNDEIFYLETEIVKQERRIDSLKHTLTNLEIKLKQKEIKPKIKKRIIEKLDTTVNKEIIINDTLKTP